MQLFCLGHTHRHTGSVVESGPPTKNVMQDIISEYLDLRMQGIETLKMARPRPKHHFLSHYPRMYYNNGPLISVWGMRMESKHTYCKSVLKTAKNFKNVALTCATRHQMVQISYYYYGMFSRSKYEIPDEALNVCDVKKITNEPLLKDYYTGLSPECTIPKKIKIFGTNYEVGKVLVLEKECLGKLKVGIIRAISFWKEANFLVTTFEAHQNKFGYYVTTAFLSHSESISFSHLADYHPLEMIGSLSSFSFILHHFITKGI